MKQCPSCLSWTADSAVFCPSCGQRLAQTPPGPAWGPPVGDDPGRTQPVHRTAPLSAAAVYAEPPAADEYPAPQAAAEHRPAPPPAARSFLDSLAESRALLIGLGVVFLCAAALAVLTLWAAAARGTNRLADRAGDFLEAPLEAAGLAPSETPLPPAPTPWPTLTAAPAETAAPPPAETPITDLQETAPPPEDGGGLQLLSPECAAALDRLEQASSQFTRSPASIFDAEWRAEAGLAASELRTACGTLESASPVPGQVQEVQRLLSLTSETYDNANRLLKEGIDERKPAKVWEAVQQFYQAIQYLNQSIKALREIGRTE